MACERLAITLDDVRELVDKFGNAAFQHGHDFCHRVLGPDGDKEQRERRDKAMRRSAEKSETGKARLLLAFMKLFDHIGTLREENPKP